MTTSHWQPVFNVRELARWLPAIVVGFLALPLHVLALQDDDEGDRRGDRREERRDWDPTEFLQRLDRDGNGLLESNEMGGRSSRFIEQLGFDPSATITVKAILNKVRVDRENQASVERRREIDANRKVPAFGEESDLPPVPGFGEASMGEAAGSEALGDRFDEEVTDAVNRMMERYDEDSDGVLAGGETRRIGRWIGGDQADTDGDGRLTPVELAESYRRTLQQRQSGQGGNNGNANADNPGRRDSEEGGRNRNRWVEGRASESPPRSEPAAQPASTPRSLDSRVSSYVDNIFRKYDTNQDNVLDDKEREGIRIPFNDTDGNGSISRDEALGYVSNSRQSGGSVSPAMAGNGQSPRGQARRPTGADEDGVTAFDDSGDMRRDAVLTGRTSIPAEYRTNAADDSRQGVAASPRFVELDTSKDGQLQMAEFAGGAQWTKELEEDFLEKDSNDDAVITPEEFDQGR